MLKLVRVTTGTDGTFGVLIKDGVPLCVTLELPWRDNERSISCIPEGQYEIFPVNSPRFGRTFQVAAVPGRSNILFHAGNTIDDTSGCILLGQSYGALFIDQRPGIHRSRVALQKFMRAYKSVGVGALLITTAYPS